MEFANNFFTKKVTAIPLWPIIVRIYNLFLKHFFTIIRTILLLTVISIGIIISILLRIVIVFSGKWRFIQINTKYVVRWTSKILLAVCGVKISGSHNFNISNSIIVSNHWGYLDSLILMAFSPCLVISNVDVEKMPIVGKIMMSMGFVFVDRNRNKTIPYIIEKTTDIIKHTNVNIAFFPEGATGDGFKLNRFKSSFFELAYTTKGNVVPVVIRVKSINGKVPNKDTINQVVFHNTGEHVIKHILKLLQLKSIGISVVDLPQISYYDITSKKLSRKDICKIAEDKISDYIYKNIKD